jgi:hypothetical protein
MNLGWVAQSQLAVLRGGLLASEASLGILGAASEKRHATHGQGGGHDTSAAHQSAHRCANQSAIAIAINRRVAPVPVTEFNQAQGAHGPSPLGTGDIDTMAGGPGIK